MSHYSELKVYPVSWEKKIKSNLKKDWEIRYTYFHKSCPSGKIIRFKGMNHASTLEEKQFITNSLMKQEIGNLSRGYNPITKEFEISSNVVIETTMFINALEIALKKIQVSKPMKSLIGDTIRLVKAASLKFDINLKQISHIRKRDIKIILDEISETKTNDRVNKVRACLIILFNYFVDMDIFEFNFIKSIKKLVHTPEKRKILRKEDKEKFAKLRFTNYKLWRFCTLFYYSGSRLEEFIKIEIEHINIASQKFRIYEMKGKRYHWVWKPININAYNLWIEIMQENNGVFVFGNDLSPSDKPTERDYVTRKWKRWAKDRLGIDADLYALKHTYLNDVTSKYGIAEAKNLAGHTNEATTRIYAVDYEDLLLEKQKTIDVSLAI